MSPRIALAGALVLLLAVIALRGPGGGAPPPPAPRRQRASSPARERAFPSPPPARNVFEFAERPAPSMPSAPPPRAEMPAPVETATAPAALPVRLVGLVRRGGALKAALSIHGETVIAGAGEAAGDYRVVAVDEDGVRLRAADGSMITLVTSSP